MTANTRPPIEVRALEPHRLDIVAEIDRAEEVTTGYQVAGGELVAVDGHWSVPSWDPVGDGEHSVSHIQKWLMPIMERGAVLLGAFAGDQPVGMAVVHPEFKGDMAWLAALWVTRSHRRQGVASALWAEACRAARAPGATSIYVSSAPTESAVGFYLRQGCQLTPDPDPELFAHEPEDIHLVCPLSH